MNLINLMNGKRQTASVLLDRGVSRRQAEGQYLSWIDMVLAGSENLYPGLKINSVLASPTSMPNETTHKGSPLIAGLPRPRYGAIMAWQVCAMLLMRVAMNYTGMPIRRYKFLTFLKSSGWPFTFSPPDAFFSFFSSFHPFFLNHTFYFLPLAARAPLFFIFFDGLESTSL